MAIVSEAPLEGDSYEIVGAFAQHIIVSKPCEANIEHYSLLQSQLPVAKRITNVVRKVLRINERSEVDVPNYS